MKRNSVNLVIDSVSALIVIGLIVTGSLLYLVLPPGSGRGRVLWGLGRHDWGNLHFWLAVAGVVILLVHLALHWQWVCVTVGRCLPGRSGASPSARRRTTIGIAALGLLAGAVGAFLYVASRSVQEIPPLTKAAAQVDDDHGARPRGLPAKEPAEAPAAESIRGSMTLAEAAQASGLSIEATRARLGLPASTSPDERLGRLAANAGTSMREFRQRLATTE